MRQLSLQLLVIGGFGIMIIGLIYLIMNWLALTEIIELSILTEYAVSTMLGRMNLAVDKNPPLHYSMIGLIFVIVGLTIFLISGIISFSSKVQGKQDENTSSEL